MKYRTPLDVQPLEQTNHINSASKSSIQVSNCQFYLLCTQSMIQQNQQQANPLSAVQATSSKFIIHPPELRTNTVHKAATAFQGNFKLFAIRPTNISTFWVFPLLVRFPACPSFFCWIRSGQRLLFIYAAARFQIVSWI